jgi:hypothetical protein
MGRSQETASKRASSFWKREPDLTLADLNATARLHAMPLVFSAATAFVLAIAFAFGAAEQVHGRPWGRLAQMALCPLAVGVGALQLRRAWRSVADYKAAHPLQGPAVQD